MEKELRKKIKKRILTGSHRVRFLNEKKTKGFYWTIHHVKAVPFRIFRILNWRFVMLGREMFMS